MEEAAGDLYGASSPDASQPDREVAYKAFDNICKVGHV